MSRVTAKYQITVPPKIRKELRLVPGTEVDIVKEGDKYVLKVNPVDGIKEKWRGKFKNTITTMQYLEDVRGPIE
ncbi:MAG: AbrB/MazE/SpoVT family DNA-binding domain-containing protein [Desulfobacterales bacterium]|jgi:AbrB family looped-hinge helix DNA binding protein